MNSTTPSDPKPVRVMIVDDHLLVRDGLSLLVSTFDDLEVVAVAENGEEAVRLCRQAQPDVILMDVVMPIMDGPTATAHIREAWPHIQVLALTSFVEEDLVQRAIGAGAIGYLLKKVSRRRTRGCNPGCAPGPFYNRRGCHATPGQVCPPAPTPGT